VPAPARGTYRAARIVVRSWPPMSEGRFAMTVDGIPSQPGGYIRAMFELIDDEDCGWARMRCDQPLSDKEQRMWLAGELWIIDGSLWTQ
jgi:hypothetical protein